MAWNPHAECDGHKAADRAKWLVENKAMSLESAQQRVMAEFPAKFLCLLPTWNPDAMCDGLSAKARAQWCMDNVGLSQEAARERVMKEFPACFSGSSWDPDIMCDGHRAEARAKWCMENCGLSEDAARQRVMKEFSTCFGASDTAASGYSGSVAALGGTSHAALELLSVTPADPALLVWSDEFDYEGPPDPAKWTHETGTGVNGWGNNELQYYTDATENSWVCNGSLRIRAKRCDFGGKEFTSARLLTKNKADWLYGRMEVRLKLPTGRGSWAAAWMLPTEAKFGEWPKSGEIDIMEHVGYDVGNVHGTVHTEKFNHMKNTQVGRVLPVTANDWHIYAVEWSPEQIRFFCDDQQYHVFKKQSSEGWEAWPFDQRFHVILNVAVGGNWGGQKGIDRDAFANDGQVMEVSWVRMYRLR